MSTGAQCRIDDLFPADRSIGQGEFQHLEKVYQKNPQAAFKIASTSLVKADGRQEQLAIKVYATVAWLQSKNRNIDNIVCDTRIISNIIASVKRCRTYPTIDRKKNSISRIEKALQRPIYKVFTPWTGLKRQQGIDTDLAVNTLRCIEQAINLLKHLTPDDICLELDAAVNGPAENRGRVKKPTEHTIRVFCERLRSSSAKSANPETIPRSEQPQGKGSPHPSDQLQKHSDDTDGLESTFEVGRGRRGRGDTLDDHENEFGADFEAVSDLSDLDSADDAQAPPLRRNTTSSASLRDDVFDDEGLGDCTFGDDQILPSPLRSHSGSINNMEVDPQPSSDGRRANLKRNLATYLADNEEEYNNCDKAYAEAWASYQAKTAALDAATQKLQSLPHASALPEKPPTSNDFRSQREAQKQIREDYARCQKDLDAAEERYLKLKEDAEKEEALRQILEQAIKTISG